MYGIEAEGTHAEFRRTRHGTSPLPCDLCGVDTRAIGEYYMVENGVWEQVEAGRFLCIGCAEDRLGRTLCHTDFIDCPLNDGAYGSEIIPQSARLRDRLGSNRSYPA